MCTLHGGGDGGASGTYTGPQLGGTNLRGRTAPSLPAGRLCECAEPPEADGDKAQQIKTIEVTSLVPL